MNYKDCIIIENQYFPVVNWIKYSFQKKYIVLSSCEAWQKMSFRNRTVICGGNGLINLSVPVRQGRNQRIPFNEVEIFYRENWQLNHWRSIVSCYGKAPFFDYYRFDLEKFFSKRHNYLFDLNLAILEWLKKMLNFPAEIIIAGNDKIVDYKQFMDDISSKWLPKNFQKDDEIVRYAQVFEDRIGFQPNVSVLDLLFNTGPGCCRLLQ
jgi:hypothetical protein